MRPELLTTGLEQVQPLLDDLQRSGTDLRGPLLAIMEDARTAMRRQYSSGTGWKPLTPEQAARKARRGLSQVPLAGGVLERDMTGHGPGSVGRVTTDELEVGTSEHAAPLHSRNPAPFSNVDVARWVLILQRGLSGAPNRRLGL